MKPGSEKVARQMASEVEWSGEGHQILQERLIKVPVISSLSRLVAWEIIKEGFVPRPLICFGTGCAAFGFVLVADTGRTAFNKCMKLRVTP